VSAHVCFKSLSVFVTLVKCQALQCRHSNALRHDPSPFAAKIAAPIDGNGCSLVSRHRSGRINSTRSNVENLWPFLQHLRR